MKGEQHQFIIVVHLPQARWASQEILKVCYSKRFSIYIVADLDKDLQSILKPVQRPTCKQRKAYTDRAHSRKVINATQEEFPPKKKKKISFYERELSLWSLEVPGVGSQLLNYLLDLNKLYQLFEEWAELCEFPDDVDSLVYCSSVRLQKIGKVVVQGRAKKCVLHSKYSAYTI